LTRAPALSIAAKSVQQSLRNAVHKREKPPVDSLPPEVVVEASPEDLEVPAYIRRRKIETQ